MESTQLLLKLVITFVYGAVLGIVTIPLSKKLALSRTEDPAVVAPLSGMALRITALILGIAASAGIIFTAETYSLLIRNLLLLIPIFGLSFVDAFVRKIPNPLLLSMLVIQTVYVVYECITTKSTEIIPKMFVGFFLGMVVCYIPSLLKIPMGAGDIKYSAVIGLVIYATGYFQSMIIMALLVGIFAIYLKITKKGGLKTEIPMGPFLSIGTVVSMCYSILDIIGVAKYI